MRTVESFEDLQCRQLWVEVCDTVFDYCENITDWPDDELSCRWYIASLNISWKIAYAFWPEDTEWVKENLPLAKKYCMETTFWSLVALKKWYITNKQYDNVLKKIKRIIKKLDWILLYLDKYGAEEKFKWNVLFGKWKFRR